MKARHGRSACSTLIGQPRVHDSIKGAQSTLRLTSNHLSNHEVFADLYSFPPILNSARQVSSGMLTRSLLACMVCCLALSASKIEQQTTLQLYACGSSASCCSSKAPDSGALTFCCCYCCLCCCALQVVLLRTQSCQPHITPCLVQVGDQQSCCQVCPALDAAEGFCSFCSTWHNPLG